MDKNARELFLKKLYEELQLFKESVMQMEKERIYEEAYKIEVYASLYEILMEQSEKYPVWLLEKLAAKENVLWLLYDAWLKKDGDLYEELYSHVTYEMKKAAERS